MPGAVTQKIGSELYLFRMDGTIFQDQLVITAHGGYEQSEPTFTVKAWPGFKKLYFYVPHGSVQQDGGISLFATGARSAVEKFGPGQQCINYSLSKYQGRHSNNAETYASIRAELGQIIPQRIQMHAKKLQSPVESVRSLAEEQGAPQAYDVLTIRNRGWMNDVSLKTALKRVMEVHVYRKVHCYFCRSLMT